jgi:hypothetical protein
MVDIVRRKDVRIIPEKAYGGDAYKWAAYEKVGSAISSVGKKISDYGSSAIKEEEKAFKEKLSKLEAQQEAEKKAYDTQKKAYDASDRLIATDRAGQLKNDLLRWNMEKRQSNPTYIGSREHESDMRAEYERLSKKYSVGLGEAGMSEFQSKTQDSVNTFINNDIKWAYEQKVKQGEAAARSSAMQIEQTSGLYGANGDILGYKDNYSKESENLRKYMNNVSPENTNKAMIELGANSVKSFVSELAQKDPVAAKNIIENPEMFKEIVPEELIQDLSESVHSAKEQQLKETRVLLNSGIANEKDSKKKKDLEKKKKQVEKEIEKLGETDYADEAIEGLRQDLKKSVDKSIDYKINLMKAEEEKMKKQLRIENSLAFMDNPIIYRATVGDGQLLNEETYKNFPELKNLQNEIYDLSDKVGDGKVNPAVMHKIVEQVASITLGDDGNVDVNILKAFDAELALRKAGASPEQLQTFHKLTANALTDSEFKTKVAALAGKPDFDTMFLDKGSRDRSLFSPASWTRTAKEDDIAYVEKMGREAYLGAMEKLSDTNNPMALEEALKFYDDKVAETYDFIKRDVIDVDYVKNQLAKMGHAMVELNGNMTKIVGRLPNGEYIVESTGEKVNGGF